MIQCEETVDSLREQLTKQAEANVRSAEHINLLRYKVYIFVFDNDEG